MTKPSSTKGHSFQQLSYDTIGACIEVQRQLGVHCMEGDYQRAPELRLPKQGLQFEREAEMPIAYDGGNIDAIRRALNLEFNYRGPFLEEWWP
jgi:GxxExxY protein